MTFFSVDSLLLCSLADNRPSGKSPVGTVQEPPSKLPGKTYPSGILRSFNILLYLFQILYLVSPLSVVLIVNLEMF